MNSSPSNVRFFAATALQVVLAGIFLYSAVTKFIDVYTFGEVVRSYGILPDALVKPAALLLPIIEVLIGAALLLRASARYAAIGVIIVSLFFAYGLIVNYGEVLPYGCGCFGPTEAHTVNVIDVGKDVVLIVAAAVLMALLKKR